VWECESTRLYGGVKYSVRASGRPSLSVGGTYGGESERKKRERQSESACRLWPRLPIYVASLMFGFIRAAYCDYKNEICRLLLIK